MEPIFKVHVSKFLFRIKYIKSISLKSYIKSISSSLMLTLFIKYKTIKPIQILQINKLLCSVNVLYLYIFLKTIISGVCFVDILDNPDILKTFHTFFFSNNFSNINHRDQHLKIKHSVNTTSSAKFQLNICIYIMYFIYRGLNMCV